jgi:hypothetical protein
MSCQNADIVLMIRPAAFGFNQQTADDNAYQKELPGLSPSQLQQKALQEFDAMVEKLRKANIEVLVIDDNTESIKTDAVFPNNWFCTMPGGSLSVFPMFAPTRRREKRDDILKLLDSLFDVSQFIDWSELEAEGFFLEGTGSMVIDHDNKIIYACLSQRTHPAALEKFAQLHNYKAITFEAVDADGKPIYHTNVMMCIGHDFAVVCDECFADEMEWIAVSQLLRTTGHKIITISRQQVAAFAGNMLQVKNKLGERVLVMSQSAHKSFTPKQTRELEKYSKLVCVEIPTIETVGGGSARCMMAELFLRRKGAVESRGLKKKSPVT